MEELISFQNNVMAQVNTTWHRYLFDSLSSEERLLGIKGLRGVGKTTMLLQYLAQAYPEKEKGLYITADHPWFYQHTLFDTAGAWYRNNGALLLIDEVHKYPNWSRELKLIHDGYPSMRVIFTSSSALDLYRGESDLSRRLVTKDLHGLSFREYLAFRHQEDVEPFSLAEILTDHPAIAKTITQRIRPLPLFKEYLASGYFPFAPAENDPTFPNKLLRIINTVLESDLAFIQEYSASNVVKIKKLLGVIAGSAPFEPNISKIAERLHLGRNTVTNYLMRLHEARVLRLINKASKGISALQKPDKIYFENTAFAYAFQHDPNLGNLRETFLLNQLHNAGHEVHLADQADFLIDGQWTMEVGGRNKTTRQIKETKNAFLALDDIESGFAQRIPLWLFGLMY